MFCAFFHTKCVGLKGVCCGKASINLFRIRKIINCLGGTKNCNAICVRTGGHDPMKVLCSGLMSIEWKYIIVIPLFNYNQWRSSLGSIFNAAALVKFDKMVTSQQKLLSILRFSVQVLFR